MSFLQTGPAGEGPNYEAVFALRPDVYAAWQQLNAAVKENMDLRRYELATLAAAKALRSSYCMLAHGTVMTDEFVSADELRAIVTDHRAADLDEVDVAVMDLAAKVVDDATAVTQGDIDTLKALGLTDAEVFDVVLAAAMRCFFSKALDGAGALPDAGYATIEPVLRDALTIGRPISGGPDRGGSGP